MDVTVAGSNSCAIDCSGFCGSTDVRTWRELIPKLSCIDSPIEFCRQLEYVDFCEVMAVKFIGFQALIAICLLGLCIKSMANTLQQFENK